MTALEFSRRWPYTLQAAPAAIHSRARSIDDTDWAWLAALYGVLAVVTPSPVVELNRAVAVGMADGPAAGPAIVDANRQRSGAGRLSPAAERPG